MKEMKLISNTSKVLAAIQIENIEEYKSIEELSNFLDKNVGENNYSMMTVPNFFSDTEEITFKISIFQTIDGMFKHLGNVSNGMWVLVGEEKAIYIVDTNYVEERFNKISILEDKGHMGKFDYQTELISPNGKKVYIDNPLVEEIKYLWKNGVETIASCSGHNKYPAVILVDSKSIKKMVEIGYKMWLNPYCKKDSARYDGFYAKSVELTDVMLKNHLKEIEEYFNQ